MSDIASGLDDLFEMRLMFEPDCAFLAAQRATQEEIDAICYYGEQVEKKILSGEDRTAEEQKFHESIANATHNAFVKQFMPVIFNAIKKGVIVMTRDKDVSGCTFSTPWSICKKIKLPIDNRHHTGYNVNC